MESANTRLKLFTWTIPNFSALNTKKHYSDVFAHGGYQWQLLIFPKGNNVDQFSVYLAIANSSNLPSGWAIYAEFGMSVLDQVNSQHTVQKDSLHLFNSKDSDWGFTRFMSLCDLHEPTKGFLLNDTLILKAQVYTPNKSKVEKDSVGPEHQVVHFRSLEKPKEDVFSLELLNVFGYDEVSLKVARYLGIHNSLRIRLTHHNKDSGEPAPTPIEYKATDRLQDMLVNNDKASNILYYEILGESKAVTVENMVRLNVPSSCGICWSEPKEGVCVPCGHVAACMACLRKIQHRMSGCPICRANIEQVIRIFVA